MTTEKPRQPFAATRLPTLLRLAICLLLLVGSLAGSLSLGARWVSPASMLSILRAKLVPGFEETLPAGGEIIWKHRVPRVLLAALVGATLAVSGVTVQTIVRNPLGDPYILGVTAGACFGAVLLLTFGPKPLSGMSLFAAAFGGGMVASLAVYQLAKQGSNIAPQQLILAGVAMTYLLSSLTSLCLLQMDRQDFGGSNNFLFWSMGSFARVHWNDLPIPALTLVIGLVVLLLCGRVLDLMNLNDESVAALGLRPDFVRGLMFVVVSFLVAACVACSGQVGFVGLVIPHISRAFCGTGHRRNLCCAALLGGTFLILADALGRWLASPQEIPVGVITAGCGAPFFIFLLRYTPGRTSS